MELQDFAPQQFYSRLAFSPAASIVDRRGETAEAMREFLKLPSLAMHPTAVEVTSEGNKDQYRIGLVQIYALLTGFDDFGNTSDRVREFMQMAVKHLNPPNVESIDVRTCDIAPAESFEDLRDRLNGTLVSDLGGVKNAIGVALSDSAWVFEFEDSGVSGRVQFGPMKSEQLEDILQVKDGIEVPPNMLFLAVDTKFQGNEHGDAVEWWEKAVARQRGIAERTGVWLRGMLA